MRDNLLFVDTETSGVPRSMSASVADLDNWPFVLQLAWRIYDRSGKLVKTENHFIWESEIFIEKSSIEVHGITEKELKAKGEERRSVMRLLLNDLKTYRPVIIGHFVEFDSKMLQVAFVRCGLKHNMMKYRHFCTMQSATQYARLPNRDYPKLGELYRHLFHEKMPTQHDAAVDAEATARCFFELYRLGEITDEMIGNQRLFSSMKERMRQSSGCGLPVLFFIIVGLIFFLI